MTLDELAVALRDALLPHVPDIEDVEIEAFLSAIVSSIGFAAIHKVERGLDGTVLHCHPHQFDFEEADRKTILHTIDASTGLGADACEVGLAALEQAVDKERESSGADVRVEVLGTFTYSADGKSRTLLLADMAVRRWKSEDESI